ncbi:hypothetical protein B296_00017157, partial [Ensete ventricosum]
VFNLKAKLGLEGLSTRQEDAEVSTLEEYATHNLALEKSLGYQHMGAVYHREKISSASTSESHKGDLIIQRIESARALQQDGGGHGWELQSVFPSTKENCLKNTEALKQAVERGEEVTTSLDSATQKQSVGQKGGGPGRRCKVTDSRAMGLATTCYCKSGTSVKSSIPCYHGGRALVVKGAEEVENAKANSKYQDKTEGQRPENFIRQVSTGFSSR